MLLDSLQEILFSLRHNKLRTFLTAFGVFWGILLLIVLLGAGKGLQNGAESGFSSNVKDSVWIFSRQTSIPYKGLQSGRRIQFTEADVEALRREIPGVLYASAENPLRLSRGGDIVVTYGNKTGNFNVLGVADDYFTIKRNLDYRQGRSITHLDNKQSRKTAIIGTLVAERLFEGQNPVGEYIKINNVSFRVVGLFYDEERQGQSSQRIYIPFSLYQKTFGKGNNSVSIMAYQPKPGYEPYQVEKDVVALLKQRHRVAPDDRSAIRSNNLLKFSEETTALFNAINLFIWFVGIGTLTAGIVGISNIMLITVKERTVEIGVRKALGARPLNIVSALLFESTLVTVLAGYLGLVCGVGLLELTSYTLDALDIKNEFFERPEVDFQIALQAIIVLVVIGALAGLVPAWRAARISPIEAIRST